MVKRTKPRSSAVTHGASTVEAKLNSIDAQFGNVGSQLNAVSALIEERNYPAKISAAQIQMHLLAGAVIKVNCRGDSTMFGATVGNLGAQDPQNAPDTFAKTLTNLYGQTPRVANQGISGSTLREMMSGTDGANPTFLNWIPTSDDQVIFCNHGINDSQTGQSIDQFRTDLIDFVNVVRKYGKLPILCTPNPCPPIAIIDEAKTKRMEMFVDVIRDVAGMMKVDLVDQYKYYMRTSRMVSLTTLVPDGAHPSSDAYAMSGRNMAIPFVSANPLEKSGDKQGLTQGTYFDNIKANRGLRNEMTPFGRFGAQLVGTKTSDPTGINMAVLLECPTDDTVLAMYGAQWNSGNIMILVDNGDWSNQFNGAIHQGDSNRGTMDWEAMYLPVKCELYAGLHVMGLLGNTSTGYDSGDFGCAGWGLVPREAAYHALETSGKEAGHRLDICTGTRVEFQLNLNSTGTAASFCRLTDGTALVNIDYVLGGTLSVTTSDGVVVELHGSVTAGVYPCRVQFNRNNTITVSVGMLTTTTPVAATPMPNMFMKGVGQIYSVRAAL